MRKQDFNSSDFSGFPYGADILIDTCILNALFSTADPWHSTINQLFEEHLFPEENAILLYVNPVIINEVMHLNGRALENYYLRFDLTFDQSAIQAFRTFTKNTLTTLIDQEVFKVLDGDKNSALKQIELSDTLGAADALNASIANLYGINFLTVDNRLVNNMMSNLSLLPNISTIYYTNPRHMDYK
ncbi:PIN domain-containing protein [Saccharibacillus sp. CPCC 101409]|uniref:PIN domain-containing protein n=1 Tax=Saccharibacillus sp. CPCC 101409 TaxID=3058041 RepID=UPI0026720800|nr:PIN domain-containing protein [Saccharibacillus sp. CPCC 101409]MDO3408906.1 PIN domain-containing protein [Saccharibacillus sp. CPCC 101409]